MNKCIVPTMGVSIVQLQGWGFDGEEEYVQLLQHMRVVPLYQALAAAQTENTNPIVLANGDGYYMHFWNGRLCQWDSDGQGNVYGFWVDADLPCKSIEAHLEYLIEQSIVIWPDGEWAYQADLDESEYLRNQDVKLVHPKESA